MKQKITVLMAFLIVMMILAGCGSSAGNKVEPKTAAEEDTGALTTHNGVVEAKPVADGVQDSAEKKSDRSTQDAATGNSGQTGKDDAGKSGQTTQDAINGNSGQIVQDDAGNSGQTTQDAVTGNSVQGDEEQWNSGDDSWKKAYLQVMEDYSWNIQTYENMLREREEDWSDDESFRTVDLTLSQMCLEDLDGDGVPELLFVADTDDDSVTYPEAQQDLYVFTYKDGEAVLLCQELAALEAGGGWQFYVAKEADKLVLVRTSNDLFQHTEIFWYRCDGKQPMELVKQQCLMDDHYYTDYVPAYRTGESVDDIDNLQEISEEEYVRLSHEATQGFEKLLIRYMHSQAPVYDYEKEHMDSVNTMTYSELYDYLQEGSDSEEAEESDSISEYFTNEQLDHIRQALGIPDNLSVDVEVGTPSYWEGGGMDLVQVDFYHEGEYAAGAACKPYTDKLARNIYVYMGDD